MRISARYFDNPASTESAGRAAMLNILNDPVPAGERLDKPTPLVAGAERSDFGNLTVTIPKKLPPLEADNKNKQGRLS